MRYRAFAPQAPPSTYLSTYGFPNGYFGYTGYGTIGCAGGCAYGHNNGYNAGNYAPTYANYGHNPFGHNGYAFNGYAEENDNYPHFPHGSNNGGNFGPSGFNNGNNNGGDYNGGSRVFPSYRENGGDVDNEDFGYHTYSGFLGGLYSDFEAAIKSKNKPLELKLKEKSPRSGRMQIDKVDTRS